MKEMAKVCANCHFELDPDEESFVRDGKVYCVPCYGETKGKPRVDPEIEPELVFEDKCNPIPSKPKYNGSIGTKVNYLPMKRVKVFVRDRDTGTESFTVDVMPLETSIHVLKHAVERTMGAELIRAVIIDRFWKSETELSGMAKAGIFLWFAGG